MADIKFYCPECRQKIAVDVSAVGMKIDCPSCRSALVIPATPEAVVEVVTRRRLATLAGTADSAYEVLERKQKELSSALEEAAQLRAESEKAKSEVEKLRQDLQAAASDRAGLVLSDAELDRVRQQLACTEAERNQLTQQLSSLQTQNAAQGEAEAELEHWRTEAARIATERDALKNAVEDAENKLKSASRPVAVVGTGVLEERLSAEEKVRAQFRTQLSEAATWKTQAEDLRGQFARLQDQFSTVSAERDSLKINAGHAVEEIKALRTAAEAARLDLEGQRARLADATAGLEVAQRGRDEFRRQWEEAQPVIAEVASARETNSRLERELEEVRQTLAARSTEHEAAHQQFAEAQITAQHLAQINGAIKAQSEQLQTRLSEVERNLSSTVQERDEARQQLADREDSLRVASLTMEAAKNELGRLKQEASEAASEQERLRNQHTEACEEAKELQQRVDNLLDDLHAREREVADTRQTLEHTCQARDGLHQHLAGAENQVRELGGRLEQAQRDHAASLQTARADAEQVAQGLRGELTTAATTHAQMEREFLLAHEHTAELDNKISSLQADLQRAQRDLADVRQQAATAREARAQAENEQEKTEQERNETQGKLNAALEVEKNLKNQLAEQAHQHGLKLGENEQARLDALAKMQAAVVERDQAMSNFDRVTAELNTVSEQLRQARQDRDAGRSSLGSMEIQLEQSLDQLHAIEAEREALKAELEAVKAGLERAKQHVSVLQSRRDQMRDEIARLKVRLGEAPDAIG